MSIKICLSFLKNRARRYKVKNQICHHLIVKCTSNRVYVTLTTSSVILSHVFPAMIMKIRWRKLTRYSKWKMLKCYVTFLNSNNKNGQNLSRNQKTGAWEWIFLLLQISGNDCPLRFSQAYRDHLEKIESNIAIFATKFRPVTKLRLSQGFGIFTLFSRYIKMELKKTATFSVTDFLSKLQLCRFN